MNTVSPESVGISSSRLERIADHMQRLVHDARFPGVLTMVSRKGQLAHCACVGMSDMAAGKPLERDAIFRIYSMSKPITAVAVMMLHDEGLFRLDSPVSEFIPEFADAQVFIAGTSRNPITVRAERPPTIRDLLTHTAGLTYGLSDDSPVDAIYRRLLSKA